MSDFKFRRGPVSDSAYALMKAGSVEDCPVEAARDAVIVAAKALVKAVDELSQDLEVPYGVAEALSRQWQAVEALQALEKGDE